MKKPIDAPRPPLDPDREEMRRLGYRTIDRLVDHLATLSDQRVGRRGTSADFAALVDEPLPRDGLGYDGSLDFFFERVVPDLTKVNHPRFHGYIPCPSSFYGALGEILAAGTNPFVGSWLGGTTVSSLELTVLRWIAEAIGYPTDAAGIFTSGGSLANLVSIAAARFRHGRETLDNGVLYFSEEGHNSAEKAAAVIGYRDDLIRKVPTDASFRMDVGALEALIEEDLARNRRPFFVCANAGTTNTGSIDPLLQLADLCTQHKMWFHIDGAYGGFAALCDEGKRKLAGLDRADSLTLDPHKWLYAPMGTGCVLVRDKDALEGAFAAHGAYLKDIPKEEVNFFDRGPELSRPARVLSVWSLLRTVGLDALIQQIEYDLAYAKLAHRLLNEDPRFETICEPELSVVAFRLVVNEGETEEQRAGRDTALMERSFASGEIMVSSTWIDGQSSLRLVVMNHRTTEDEIRRTIRVLGEFA
ncbi:MAG: aminotransferase class V-fold PLP-dependent enzyme [Pirellulaceae bacterium]|nr:aminotransferase class V-fold PLP-dependent enzyme [Planctomycetaceae bacterium]HIM28209.1 aminotransferase class V-fold PLP-dependent enzyme [Planctomycetota bacterium]